MSKLKKFNKSKKKNIMPLVALCLVVAIISATISYAVYQKTDEVLFINARVGEFSSSDIELAMTLDGEDVEVPPSKGDYSVTIECDNADGTWNNEKWLAEIGNIRSNRVKCNVNFKTPAPVLSEIKVSIFKTSINLNYSIKGGNVKTTCKWGESDGNYPNVASDVTNTNCIINNLEEHHTYYYKVCAVNNTGENCKTGNAITSPLADNVELGDYISMTPTATSYTISKEDTDYSSDQTINPSELNLWRVIRKNEDGTVDAVSEYISSEEVYFANLSQTGKSYLNYVNTLNEIAKSYTNAKYVEKTRHVGYSNQQLKCETLSTCEVDTGYLIDDGLIKQSVKTLLTSTPTGSNAYHWVASRFLFNGNYCGRTTVESSEDYSGWGLCKLNGAGSWVRPGRIRPIIILKSSVKIISGDGKSSSTAYKFE